MRLISRHNWKEHCAEPPLTADEWQEWNAACVIIRAGDPTAGAIFSATRQETVELLDAEERATTWEAMAAWADAQRRFMRATIEAMKEARQ